MSELFAEIAQAPSYALAIGGVIAVMVLIGVVKLIGQVVYVLVTGHVPEGRRAYGYGHGAEIDAGSTGGMARWLFGNGDKEPGEGGGWFGWGGDGDGGGDGGGD